jgi:hypothetical protein
MIILLGDQINCRIFACKNFNNFEGKKTQYIPISVPYRNYSSMCGYTDFG